ncbi:MAG: inorganic phosphate transporter [Clostridia bacterium]|nr:inorganic phosphate transporter [Clostridia bacterium]
MIVLFTILVLSVILVNGWTDAPNAISTCVSSRSMSPGGALCLAAVCNFTGSVAMALINSRVAKTIFNIVNLSDNPDVALSSLCAGMCAVVIWAIAAWRFGIPTSESHALISGITGAALASTKSISSINLEEWRLVLCGLFFSTLPAFILASIIYTLMTRILGRFERRKMIKYFMRTQRCSAATSALLHGAQDSQKFMGVFMLGFSLISQNTLSDTFELPLFVIFSCAAVMTLGTLIGGGRIIKKIGMDMVSLDAAGGTAADMSSSAVLAVCSFFGIPVSTTHSKACAMMGVGASLGSGGTNKKIVSQMLCAWLLTFPICFCIGFLLAFFISP